MQFHIIVLSTACNANTYIYFITLNITPEVPDHCYDLGKLNFRYTLLTNALIIV